MKLEKIDHICFAVKDLNKTKETYREDFGLVPDVEYEAPSEKIRVARYYIGEVAVEFMESTDTHGEVSKFIDRKGEGFFLISYKVDNVPSAMRELADKGRKLIDHDTRSLFGTRYAFVHYTRELNNVLVELLDGEFDMTKK
jgi:methylmalonyl-CoA/ethylmalonyl-CoA epimerase